MQQPFSLFIASFCVSPHIAFLVAIQFCPHPRLETSTSTTTKSGKTLFTLYFDAKNKPRRFQGLLLRASLNPGSATPDIEASCNNNTQPPPMDRPGWAANPVYRKCSLLRLLGVWKYSKPKELLWGHAIFGCLGRIIQSSKEFQG